MNRIGLTRASIIIDALWLVGSLALIATALALSFR